MSDRKVGDGHAMGMGRLGMKEFTHGILPAFPQGHQIIEEPGLVGNPTQGEVAQARRGAGDGPEQESPGKMSLQELKGHAQERAQEANRRMEPGQDQDRKRGGMEM